MTDQTEGGAPDADPLPTAVGSAEADRRNLRSVVRWVAVEVFLYVIVALALISLALRRGRLSDAILVMLTLLITTPMILGYRQQALARLRPRPKPSDDACGPNAGNGPNPAPPASS